MPTRLALNRIVSDKCSQSEYNVTVLLLVIGSLWAKLQFVHLEKLSNPIIANELALYCEAERTFVQSSVLLMQPLAKNQIQAPSPYPNPARSGCWI
jgi:hypothetical protein